MADEHARRIIALEEARRNEREHIASERREREQSDQRFAHQWNTVFPDSGHLNDSVLSSKIASNYLSLAEGIRERLWDFQISHWLSREMSVPGTLAIRLLAHACVGDRSSIIDCLMISDRFASGIVMAHIDFQDVFRVAAAPGLPLTPLLTLDELATVAGVSREAK
jgi:hypothetical protein